MNASDCGSTGAFEMSWFHQLSDGNSGRPPKSSVSCTPADVVGLLDPPPDVGPPGTLDGPVPASPPPHADATIANQLATAMETKGSLLIRQESIARKNCTTPSCVNDVRSLYSHAQV